MKIIFETDNTEIIGELELNEFSKLFIKQLPIRVKIDDYAATEKIFYPPFKLENSDTKTGYKPSAGDISYYAPWGNIAIFYKEFSYADGLIYLGKIITGKERVKKELSGLVEIRVLD